MLIRVSCGKDSIRRIGNPAAKRWEKAPCFLFFPFFSEPFLFVEIILMSFFAGAVEGAIAADDADDAVAAEDAIAAVDADDPVAADGAVAAGRAVPSGGGAPRVDAAVTSAPSGGTSGGETLESSTRIPPSTGHTRIGRP